MKHRILIACLLTSTISFAQKDTTKVKLPLKEGMVVFEEVVTLDSSYKINTLYKSAKTWFVNSFKNAKAVIQSEDQTNGRFLGKAYTEIPEVTLFNNPIRPTIQFYIQIDIKDGKYRYRFYDLKSIANVVAPEETPIEQAYNQYLENKNQKGFISRENYNKRADKAFNNLISQFRLLGDNLKATIAKESKDDF